MVMPIASGVAVGEQSTEDQFALCPLLYRVLPPVARETPQRYWDASPDMIAISLFRCVMRIMLHTVKMFRVGRNRLQYKQTSPQSHTPS